MEVAMAARFPCHPPPSTARKADSTFPRTRCSLSTSAAPLHQQLAARRRTTSSDLSLFKQRITSLCSNGSLQEALLLLQDSPLEGRVDAVGALLQACGKREALEVGRRLHDIVSSSEELMGNAVLTTRLLTMYSMCGAPDESRRVFEGLVRRNLFQWNALISGYSRNELWEEALDAFSLLLSTTDLRPDNFTLPCVLRACSGLPSVEMGRAVHGLVLKMGLGSDAFVCNSLISMYGRCGHIHDVFHLFDTMPERNVVSWNTMICVLSENGFVEECLDLFRAMLVAEEDIEVDDATLVTILPVCAAEGWIEMGRLIHSLAVKLDLNHQLRVSNALIDMYSKCGCLPEARWLFDKALQRNVVSWNAMIGGYARNGDICEAFELLREMPRNGLEANEITILNVLPACIEQSQVQVLEELHGYAIRDVYQFNDLLENALIAAYAKCGSLKSASTVFSGIESKTVSSWNAFIGGYAQNDDPKKAIDLYLEMTASGLEPDLFSIGSLLLACTNLRYLMGGRSIHAFILRNKFEKDSFILVSLLSLYIQCGETSTARMLFDRMEERNLVCWNAMIAGLVQNGLPGEAFQFFHKMQQEGFQISDIASTSVFMACSQLSALRQGKEMHCFSLKANLCDDTFMGSSIIDMYTKCGSIEYACKFFDGLQVKDVVSWNVTITGYGIHGCGHEAIELFERMQMEGAMPDTFTFIGILMACCHAGLVEEGLEFFEVMKTKYGLEPKVEHFSCVADMLGRAGRLDDAISIIEEMPEEPDGRMWSALLGACRIHGDVELGEKITNKLLELEPHKAEHYVLAANLFAGSGRWEDMTSLRKQMRDMGLQKETGCSWINVNGKLYEFVAGDD
ncbi:hypothetical protein Taro_053953 [Colocasia esculenta]|uniref:Uncharacterized protein n=1 Tax=Colocasia esculenta TaxID=4460 RepID=A0A843XMG9_COLES|nr:hypothetical protein [Colocasia esculenta]